MKNSITYKSLIAYILSFILGVVIILIIQNFLSKELLQFSTIGLIGFVPSVALAFVSIILAITAITLGSASEKIMIERSDKSIELQNDVHGKTLDVLNKIDSSTGVTEKRVEDIRELIIRDDNFSKPILEHLISGKTIQVNNKEKAEKEMTKALITELIQLESKWVEEGDSIKPKNKRIKSDEWAGREERVLQVDKEGAVSATMGFEKTEYVETYRLTLEDKVEADGTGATATDDTLITSTTPDTDEYAGMYAILTYTEESNKREICKIASENVLFIDDKAASLLFYPGSCFLWGANIIIRHSHFINF